MTVYPCKHPENYSGTLACRCDYQTAATYRISSGPFDEDRFDHWGRFVAFLVSVEKPIRLDGGLWMLYPDAEPPGKMPRELSPDRNR